MRLIYKHLQDEKVSVFGCAETFLKSDAHPAKLDANYTWVGKCRKGYDKGGLGICSYFR